MLSCRSGNDGMYRVYGHTRHSLVTLLRIVRLANSIHAERRGAAKIVKRGESGEDFSREHRHAQQMN